ncbi:MAG: T9SS type A sorting domain-containing protein [Bacteroidia bacterium]|nr:T9SS type A sorting domain-containing protein [Bacteroidia bacterium]
MKLIPRDDDNMGRFVVAGKCFNPEKKYVRLLLHNAENDTYIYDKTIRLDEESKFSATLEIPAKFEEYKLIIYSYDEQGNQNLVKEVPGLVAGDYFLISGQSNAVGSNGYSEEGLRFDSTYANKYCRSLGTLYERAEYINWNLSMDCGYYKPSSIYFEHGCIASWPYRLMYELCKKTGVPLCFINSGKGGSSISYHMASNTPSDQSRLQVVNDTSTGRVMRPYDRAYIKLLNNDVLRGIKGIVWYQGETDGNLTYEDAMDYTTRFGKLRESWKSDYPNLKKIFVFQLNTGCYGDYEYRIREQQRQWPLIFNDVLVLPTFGFDQYDKSTDGCHYTLKGANRLAEILYPVVLNEIYGFNYPRDQIMGPSIQKISYVSSSQLCLEFDMDIEAQLSTDFSYPYTGTTYLKDYFYKKSFEQLLIQDIHTQGNKLYLTMSNMFEKTDRLTYLPNILSKLQTGYMGPWIVNKNNPTLGALSFFEFPVGGGYVNVFPSPADEFIEIRLFNKTIKEIRLYDLNGNLFVQIEPDPDKTKLEIAVSQLEPGVYSLVFVLPESTIVKKVLVQH